MTLDLSHDVYDDFIDSLADMMALGITSIDVGVFADMPAPVHATAEDEVVEEDEVGILGPLDEKGPIVGVTEIQVAGVFIFLHAARCSRLKRILDV